MEWELLRVSPRSQWPLYSVPCSPALRWRGHREAPGEHESVSMGMDDRSTGSTRPRMDHRPFPVDLGNGAKRLSPEAAPVPDNLRTSG